MPTVRQFEYFAAVAEAGSIRKAADRMDVSQPTLSVQLNALEKDLGVALLERARNATSLTPAGRELLPAVRQLLASWHEVTETAHALNENASSTHRLGVPPTLGPYLLPNIVPEIHRRFQRLKLYVREEVPRELEAGLIDGRHDLILAPMPLSRGGLKTEVLFREPLMLVAPTEAAFDPSVELTEEDLAGLDILGLDERHHLHREVRRICERTGARMNRDFEGTSLDTLRQMIVMGMGVAFLPALYIRSEIHRPEELKIIRVRGANLYREHALVYRPTSPARHLYRALAQLIREQMANAFGDIVTPIYGREDSADLADAGTR